MADNPSDGSQKTKALFQTEWVIRLIEPGGRQIIARVCSERSERNPDQSQLATPGVQRTQ